MARTPRTKASSSKVRTSVPDKGSLLVRKISNGYVVTTSRETKQGFTSSEKFFPKKPNINIT